MDYKDEMRKLIDIVKQQSFTAPLEQTLDDMKMMANAVKDMSDRIDLRVRKSLQPTDKAKKKTTKIRIKNIIILNSIISMIIKRIIIIITRSIIIMV